MGRPRSRSRSRHGRAAGRRGKDRSPQRSHHSRSGRGSSRTAERDRNSRSDRGGTKAEERDREQDEGPAKNGQAKNSGMSGQSAREKAKQAMEKEREKARLKKQEMENSRKEKDLQKQENRDKRREELSEAIATSVDEEAKEKSQGANLHIAAQSQEEQKSEAAKAMTAAEKAAEAAKHIGKRLEGADVPTKRPSRTAVVDQGDVRKLFELMDRSGKKKVSQRDMLIALRKHHAVRQLFDLAVNEASVLEKRLLAIQEAFEAGSGLGEVGAMFTELAAGSTGQIFEWEAFLAACTKGSLKGRAWEAAASLPREHSQGPAFIATKEWQVVPSGAACPAGLEYRMDMETGQTLGRLPKKVA